MAYKREEKGAAQGTTETAANSRLAKFNTQQEAGSIEEEKVPSVVNLLEESRSFWVNVA